MNNSNPVPLKGNAPPHNGFRKVRTPEERKETISRIVDGCLEDAGKILATLSGKTKLEFIIKLLPYVQAKMLPDGIVSPADSEVLLRLNEIRQLSVQEMHVAAIGRESYLPMESARDAIHSDLPMGDQEEEEDEEEDDDE